VFDEYGKEILKEPASSDSNENINKYN